MLWLLLSSTAVYVWASRIEVQTKASSKDAEKLGDPLGTPITTLTSVGSGPDYENPWYTKGPETFRSLFGSLS